MLIWESKQVCVYDDTEPQPENVTVAADVLRCLMGMVAIASLAIAMILWGIN